MAHSHDHGIEQMGDRKLALAVAVNMLLTGAQLLGGLISGSLSLIADALHNFSDAASLAIALFARKIGRKPPDAFKTFGYKRAEIIAALINLTTLILLGLYLIYEALWRLVEPEPIAGWIVVIVAAIALIVDVVTALLTFRMAKHSMNVKAAFLHNISDAMASVGVIIAGSCIILYQWYWVDTALTLVIAGYVLWQGATMLPATIHVLMEGAPPHIDRDQLIAAMEAVEGVENVHHVHVWQLDEHRNALEAHVVTSLTEWTALETMKCDIKALLHEAFSIEHSTLEFESDRHVCISLEGA